MKIGIKDALDILSYVKLFMKTIKYLVLAIAVCSIMACNRKYYCKNRALEVQFSKYDTADLKSIAILKYEEGSNFSVLTSADTISFFDSAIYSYSVYDTRNGVQYMPPYSIFITAGADWKIEVIATGQSITISNISLNSDYIDTWRDPCYNGGSYYLNGKKFDFNWSRSSTGHNDIVITK